MGEWVYKATMTKRSYEDTVDLVMKYSFLCRSEYANESRKRPSRITEVKLEDIIHFYYVRGRDVAELGSYRIVDGKGYPGRFSEPSPETALVSVLENDQNAALLEFLKRKNSADSGYEPDPVLGVFTGWALDRIGKAPRFDHKRMFPGSMINLWHYPDPNLLHRATR